MTLSILSYRYSFVDLAAMAGPHGHLIRLILDKLWQPDQLCHSDKSRPRPQVRGLQSATAQPEHEIYELELHGEVGCLEALLKIALIHV